MSSFTKKYELKEEIGSGGFATVHKCIKKGTSTFYAVKVVKLKHKNKKEFKKLESEANICKKLDHINIVRFHELITSDDSYHFIFDLVEGGELFAFITNNNIGLRRVYSESDACNFVKQITQGIKHIHSKDIIHRDLKPENILLTEPNAHATVKIADFGLAVQLGSSMCTRGSCGTEGYRAPEMLKQERYGKPFDCWALGILAYILIIGFAPFQSERESLEDIKAGRFIKSKEWETSSEDSKKFISDLLNPDPDQRMIVTDAELSAWFVNNSSKSLNPVLGATVENMQKFNASRKFKGIVNALIGAGRIGRAVHSSPLVEQHDSDDD